MKGKPTPEFFRTTLSSIHPSREARLNEFIRAEDAPASATLKKIDYTDNLSSNFHSNSILMSNGIVDLMTDPARYAALS